MEEDNFSIWNNPMIRAAKQKMSQEDQDRLKKLGESLYKDVEFETSKTNNEPPPMKEALAYIEESIKSGLHPSMLEDNEKALLENMRGKEWYKKWGYIEADLYDIVTIKK